MRVHTFTGNGFETGFVEVEIGARATVFRFGGFLKNAMFGEGATLKRTTKQHLVFVTDSGAEVKTSIWNLLDVRGKAAKEGYGVRLGEPSDKMIKEHVRFWNDKKCCFETK